MLQLLDLSPDDIPDTEECPLTEDDRDPKGSGSDLTGSNIFENFPAEVLSAAILEHNKDFPVGQETVFNGTDDFHGFIRVQLNLRRPINVLPGTRYLTGLVLTPKGRV